MVLTKKILRELEKSLRIVLTREQRSILFLWYGSEPDKRRSWDEEDFVYGIRKVQSYYPDHRSKPIPDFLKQGILGFEEFDSEK